MSQNPRIVAAVERFAATTPLPAPLEVHLDQGHTLTLSLTAAGPAGVAIEALGFQAADRSPRSPEAVLAWADRLTRRITYLMEPLKVIEHDRDAGEVEVRSQTPTTRQGKRHYYEARLRADGSLRLARVAFDEASRGRADVPYQLTLEVVERLADDLVACAG